MQLLFFTLLFGLFFLAGIHLHDFLVLRTSKEHHLNVFLGLRFSSFDKLANDKAAVDKALKSLRSYRTLFDGVSVIWDENEILPAWNAQHSFYKVSSQVDLES